MQSRDQLRGPRQRPGSEGPLLGTRGGAGRGEQRGNIHFLVVPRNQHLHVRVFQVSVDDCFGSENINV